MRYAAYGLAGFILGASCLLLWALCTVSARADQLHGEMMMRELRHREFRPPTRTVVWRDTDVMFMAMTGTVELVGDYHLRITDEAGFAQMVDRRDVIEVH